MTKHVLKKHVHGFTSVSNKVINALKKDLECLGLYLSLLSLPNDWDFYKSTLCTEYSIGIKKLERLLKKLRKFGLLDFAQIRDEKGRFAHFEMHIYDTEQPNISEEDIHLNENVTENVLAQPEGQNCRTVKTVGRIGEATKETSTKEELNNKIYSASDDAHSNDDEFKNFPFFILFWSIYPRKKDKKRAFALWKRKKYEERGQLICDDVKNRLANDPQWKKPEYIPHPSTYLRNDRHEDEITSGPGTTRAYVPSLSAKQEQEDYKPCTACQRPTRYCECGKTVEGFKRGLQACKDLMKKTLASVN